MNELATLGKRRALMLFASIIILSITSIITFHSNFGGIVLKSLFFQLIRVGLTITLMYYILKGKVWVKNLFSIFLIIGIIIAALALFIDAPINVKTPFIVTIAVYTLGVYHLNISNSFKAYFLLYEH